MKEIMTVSKELISEAEGLSQFRNKMKAYLADFDEWHDKFTVKQNDNILGHVSETAVTKYLLDHYGSRLEVRHWADRFNMDRIKNAVNTHSGRADDVEYVKSFFYDKYDLEIIDKKSGKRVYVDVKTAETAKVPQDTWDFLYPVVQNQRSGKDCVILCYYYKQAAEKKIILVGYITEQEISRKKILPVGEKTRFGTVNQIDNYETDITDYKDLTLMLKQYFGV